MRCKAMFVASFITVNIGGCGFLNLNKAGNNTQSLDNEDEELASTVDGDSTFASYDPFSTRPQILKASATSSVKDTSLTVPPGSLRIAAKISIAEGAGLTDVESLSEVQISHGKILSQSAPVFINSDGNEDPLIPLSLRIPIPSAAGLAGASYDTNQIVILFRVESKATGIKTSGLIPRSEIEVIGSHVVVPVHLFGVYQAVYVQEPPLQRMEKITISPIETKTQSAARKASTSTVNRTVETSSPPASTQSATLSSISISPANPTLSEGSTAQFALTGTFSDGSSQNLNTNVTWASVSPTVATIGSDGLANVVGAWGTTTITASYESFSSSTTLTAFSNLYLSDSSNHRVRKVSGANLQISTFAGGGSRNGAVPSDAGIDSNYIAIDSYGNLFISDRSSNVVRVVASTNGSILGVSVTAGRIYTVAGNGGEGFSGDGGIATAATMNGVAGIAIDSTGNLFIADSNNKRIRVVAASNGTIMGVNVSAGNIYTVAGTGQEGFTGDGGNALAATLASPKGLAVDSDNNLYFIDHARVRAIAAVGSQTLFGVNFSAAGQINIVAGGLGSGSTTAGEFATNTFLAGPNCLAFDSTVNMYITDLSAGKVWLVPSSTTTILGSIRTANKIYAIAGDGTVDGDGVTALTAGLNSPRGVTVDSAGNIFVADTYLKWDGTYGNRVRVIAVAAGTILGVTVGAEKIYTLAGTGVSGLSPDGTTALSALVKNPWGVIVDASGNLFINDSGNNLIRVVPAAETTIFGAFMTANKIYTVAGNQSRGSSGDGSLAAASQIHRPAYVAIDAMGNKYISESQNHTVRVLAALSGTILGIPVTAGSIYTVAGTGEPGFNGDQQLATNSNLYSPEGLAVDDAGNLYIADLDNSRIRVVAAVTGTVLGISVEVGKMYTVAGGESSGDNGDGGQAILAGLSEPSGVVVDAMGNLFIADVDSTRVRIVTATDGDVYSVQNAQVGNIYAYAGDGNWGLSGDNGPALSASLDGPADLAVDKFGNLFVADRNNHVIRVIAAQSGTIAGISVTANYIYTLAGVGQSGYSGDNESALVAKLWQPVGVSVDNSGNVFIADYDNHAIRMVAGTTGNVLGRPVEAGKIYTVVGNGSAGFSGDGGAAASAKVNYPKKVVIFGK